MAGIGFQLKKVFKENSIIYGLKGYTYSSIVVVGPMLLCILIIGGAQFSLSLMDAPVLERQLFLAATLYAFMFSQIISSFFTLFISRFVADQLFIQRKEGIISSLYGLMIICLILGSIASFLFYLRSPLSLSFKILSYLFFVQLLFIWLQSIYISALREYMKIIRGFVIGALVCFISFFVTYVLNVSITATISLCCVNLGFFVMLILFFREIKKEFPTNNHEYFTFLENVEKYPALIFVGILYMVGLYGHNIIIWFGRLQEQVGETFILATYYDVPTFYASLSIFPALILFVVSTETKFYEKYRDYFAAILGSFPLGDIKNAKKEMIHVLQYQITFIMEMQLVVTLVAITLGIKFLPYIGLSPEQIDIFMLLTIANYFYILMFVVILLLLYFDDRKGALMTTLLYTSSTLVLTVVFATIEQYGFANLLTGLAGFLFAIFRFQYYIKNLDYFTFCSQPILYVEKKNILERLRGERNRIRRRT